MISSRSARLGVRALALLGATLTLPACATMTRGTTQQFTVESIPSGARVSTSNGFTCAATPCVLRLPRKDAFTATIEMDGYVTQTHQVESGMSGAGGAAMAGNVLIGGVIGAGVDVASGALNDLKPNPLSVTLLTPAQDRARRAADPTAPETPAPNPPAEKD